MRRIREYVLIALSSHRQLQVHFAAHASAGSCQFGEWSLVAECVNSFASKIDAVACAAATSGTMHSIAGRRHGVCSRAQTRAESARLQASSGPVTAASERCGSTLAAELPSFHWDKQNQPCTEMAAHPAGVPVPPWHGSVSWDAVPLPPFAYEGSDQHICLSSGNPHANRPLGRAPFAGASVARDTWPGA